jgi:kinesin family protein 22
LIDLTFERKAIYHRAVAATHLNSESSRSHLILRINYSRPSTVSGQEYIGVLNLVDLAGSEDNKRTGNSGTRLIESGAINKSLFVLGQVVDALNSKSLRIPYR